MGARLDLLMLQVQIYTFFLQINAFRKFKYTHEAIKKITKHLHQSAKTLDKTRNKTIQYATSTVHPEGEISFML